MKTEFDYFIEELEKGDKRDAIHYSNLTYIAKKAKERFVKINKPSFIPRNIVNQLFDIAEVPVEKRQAVNDNAEEFVYKMCEKFKKGE